MATVGVLALQGNFAQHQLALQALGVDAPLIRVPDALSALDGLIIPGGESTALLTLMRASEGDWFAALRHFVSAGKGLWGTCAGMILMARHVEPEQPSLGVIDCTVQRNAYGRQLDSHVAYPDDSSVSALSTIPLVFIRAPQVLCVGPAVDVLVTCAGVPVCLQQENVLVSSFHPEMTEKHYFHRYFCDTLIGASI